MYCGQSLPTHLPDVVEVPQRLNTIMKHMGTKPDMIMSTKPDTIMSMITTTKPPDTIMTMITKPPDTITIMQLRLKPSPKLPTPTLLRERSYLEKHWPRPSACKR